MIDQFEQKLFRMAGQEQMVLPDTLHKKIDDILVSLPETERRWRLNWKTSLILAAALTMMLSVTVSAAVGALRERMEAMNEKEIEDYFLQLYTSKLGMDNYNRPMTDAEKQRLETLAASYEEEALFPQGVLAMIPEPEAYKGKGVAFYKDTGTFFFPEGEMSDEELLQIIDFRHRRDYSLQKMNEQLLSGETEFPREEIIEEKEARIEATAADILQSDAIWDPAQELTIPYTGSLEINSIAAGRDCIFLMGWSEIHKMEIGGSDSELFFDDFDRETYVSALYQDKKGDVYAALMERVDGAGDITMGGEKFQMSLWVLSADGDVKRKIDMSPYKDSGYGVIRRMVVDEQGYIYLRGAGSHDKLLLVLDEEGNYVKEIASGLESAYWPHPLAGLGIGKDGKVYTQVETGEAGASHMGIASVNLETGTLEDVYMDIVPEDTIMLDIIAPGADTDFVFWGYDGIFTYNLGEESAVNILPAYEAPCEWEGCEYCALPDGRIVFVACTEYRVEESAMKVHRIPEKTCFYYKSGLRGR